MCVPKKNKDPRSCDSYRPIIVYSVIAKLFEKSLLLKISNRYDHGDHQFCFRVDVGVGNAKAVFESTLERYERVKKPLFVCAIDISKVFDLILHSHAISAILRSRVNPFICASLWQCYQNPSIRVRVENIYSRQISVCCGSKQGSV